MDEYLSQSLKLGDWNQEKQGKGLIINTGMYQIDDMVKTRGVPKGYIKNWFDFCEINKIYKKKSFEIPHMRKLSEGLVMDKSLINVNTVMIGKKSVNCNSDTKRDWLKDFESFNDVLSYDIDSYPYYSYDDGNNAELHPNPLCVAFRYEYNNPNAV
jgi:hypothetical protein